MSTLTDDSFTDAYVQPWHHFMAAIYAKQEKTIKLPSKVEGDNPMRNYDIVYYNLVATKILEMVLLFDYNTKKNRL